MVQRHHGGEVQGGAPWACLSILVAILVVSDTEGERLKISPEGPRVCAASTAEAIEESDSKIEAGEDASSASPTARAVGPDCRHREGCNGR